MPFLSRNSIPLFAVRTDMSFFATAVANRFLVLLSKTRRIQILVRCWMFIRWSFVSWAIVTLLLVVVVTLVNLVVRQHINSCRDRLGVLIIFQCLKRFT
jgi:hypothetical protein